MNDIKRGTTPTINVKIDGLDFGEIQKVEFVFKYRAISTDPEICSKYYPGGGVSYDSSVPCFSIRFSDEETREFAPGSRIYMDTRITLVGGAIPMTNIAQFSVTETLFGEVT